MGTIDTLRQLISDADLGKIEMKDLGVDQDDISILDFSGLVFNLEAGMKMSAFNAPKKQNDDDRVLGKTEAGTERDVQLAPQIEFTGDKAWMKYRFRAGLGISAAPAGGPVSLDFGTTAIFTDYRRHERQEKALDAILADLSAPRFAARWADIEKLEPGGEALSYQVRGRVGARITLSWSDVLSSNLSAFNDLIGRGTLLTISTTLGAKASFGISFEDDFLAVFSRPSADRFQIAVKKAESRKTGGDVRLGVEAVLSAGPLVEQLTDRVFSGLVGAPSEDLNELLSRSTVDDLSDQQKAILERLLRLMRLNPDTATLADARSRLEGLKKTVNERLTGLAQLKAAAAFEYHYLRTRTDSTLLEAVLSREELERQHRGLIRADLGALLKWLEENPGALRNYLHEKKLERTESWGFTLGIGPWKMVSTDRLTKSRAVQENTEHQQRIGYTGLRSYQHQWADEKVFFGADFNAQMQIFSRDAARAAADEFDYGLHLFWQWKTRRVSQLELAEYLDAAVIWKVIQPLHVAEAGKQIEPLRGERAEVRVELKITPEIFPQVLSRAAAAGSSQLAAASALAEALPWWEAGGPARTESERRRRLYAQPWEFYLSRPELGFRDYARAAREALRGHPVEHLEGMESNTANFRSFAKVIQLNGTDPLEANFSRIFDSWNAFVEGLASLQRAIQRREPSRRIEKAFERMVRFWNQPLFVRACGVFLLDAVRDTPTFARIEKTMTWEFPEKDTALTFSGPELH